MPTDTRAKVGNLKVSLHSWSGATPTYSTATVQSWRDYDSRTYVHARKRPKGFVNPKPYTRYMTTGTQYYMRAFVVGTKKANPGQAYSIDYMYANPYFATAPSFDGDLVSRALLDARLKVKEQSVNFAVALAESGRTARLLGDSAKRIADTGFKMGDAFLDYRRTGLKVAKTATKLATAALAVKSGKFQKAATILGINRPGKLPAVMKKTRLAGKHVAKNWLEFQYGWKPLMNDIFGTAEHLAKRNSESPQRFGCVVKSRKSREGTIYVYGQNNLDIPFRVNTNGATDWNNSVFVRMDYRQKHADMAELARTGITNPLEVAWELVPFSFVIDWFAPVNKFLSALDAESGWEFISGSQTKRHNNVYKMFITPAPQSYDSSLSASGFAKFRDKGINRTVLYSSPIPPFFFKNPVSPTHLANATALIATAFGGKYR